MKASQRGGVASSLLALLGIAVLLVLLLPDFFLGGVSSYLTVDQPPEKSDAIVLLLGSDRPDRVIRAYQLWQEGFAPRLLMAVGPRFSDESRVEEKVLGADGEVKLLEKQIIWQPMSARYTDALQQLGVPAASILTVESPEIYDTDTELTLVANEFRKMGWQSALLVSSRSHTRRIRLIWDRLAPDISARVIAAPAPGFDHWWNDGRHLRSVGYEFGALLKEACAQLRMLVKASPAPAPAPAAH